MSDLRVSDLIDLLERATGPDRWLDAKIDAALRIGSDKMRGVGYEWAWDNFPVWSHHKQARGMCGVQHNNGDLGLIWDSPAFTASVDAAMVLANRVLPGWTLNFEATNGIADDLYFIGPQYRDDQPEKQSSRPIAGKPIALAIVIAVLRANGGDKP